MGIQPLEADAELKLFDTRQTGDGKVEAMMPTASMEIGDGKLGIVSTALETFDTQEEADAAVEKAKKKFE